MSKLIDDLNIVTKEELEKIMRRSSQKARAMASTVIFTGKPYAEVGKQFKVTKHAVYEMLKRLYYKKYGVEYHRYLAVHKPL